MWHFNAFLDKIKKEKIKNEMLYNEIQKSE